MRFKKMRIGVCGGVERIKAAAESGFDYFEPGFRSLALADDETYQQFKAELEKYGIPCDAANCLLPGDIKIVGKNIDYDYIKSYLKKGYARAAEVGVKTVVLGSGSARSVPDGYPYKDGVNDIIRFVKLYAAPMAAEYDITFVFEPLCKKESNIINTITEGAMLASAIDMPNVASLADLYHMYVEGDTYDDIRRLKGMIRHAHISNPAPTDPDIKRVFMKSSDEFDYKGFFDALKYAGCERVSIEAVPIDYETDVREAVKIMNMYK